MDKKTNEKLSQFKTAQHSNKENTMSNDNQKPGSIDAEFSKVNPNPNTGDQPGVDEKKDKPAKPGVFSVIGTKIKTTVVGGYTFAKETAGQAWNAVVQYYKDIKKNIEEKGLGRWFMDGLRKNSYGFLKLSLKVTAFVLVHNLIVNATGFSILNPYFLLGLLVVALGLSVYSSYKAQKVMNPEKGMDAKTTAVHLFQEMKAA